MSLPDFRARTLAENVALMERSRLVPTQKQAYATPQDMARAIDEAIKHGKFYTQAAQVALTGLTILRDQLAAAPENS
ncbi:hypothetical protein RA280_19590 [Cupriavidus sp. CV2]|uniref:hypothetical protein n=1 Tax=Cupriavidus ulmosensis TaxID=3065913 RepID=UPI00296AFED4|nr:hypothetical protein [Cupriavidus sp. CV2]MDW3683906.1 hypothetical protein [Cupriavidus sp. CV2]